MLLYLLYLFKNIKYVCSLKFDLKHLFNFHKQSVIYKPPGWVNGIFYNDCTKFMGIYVPLKLKLCCVAVYSVTVVISSMCGKDKQLDNSTSPCG